MKLFELNCNLSSEFDALQVDGGDWAIAAAGGLAGSGSGIVVTIDDTNVIYGQKNFSISNHNYRFRLYLDPNTLTMAEGNAFVWAQVENGASGRVWVWLIFSGGDYRLQAQLKRDNASWLATATVIVTDAPHWIEVNIIQASSSSANNGKCQLFIDNNTVPAAEIIGQDLYDLSKPNNLKIGAMEGIDAGTSGSFYLDEVIFRDDNTLIGPVSVFVPPLKSPASPGLFPPPNDWDEVADGFCVASLLIPNSPRWKSIYRGRISELAILDAWDGDAEQEEAAKIAYGVLKSLVVDC